MGDLSAFDIGQTQKWSKYNEKAQKELIHEEKKARMKVLYKELQRSEKEIGKLTKELLRKRGGGVVVGLDRINMNRQVKELTDRIKQLQNEQQAVREGTSAVTQNNTDARQQTNMITGAVSFTPESSVLSHVRAGV